MSMDSGELPQVNITADILDNLNDAVVITDTSYKVQLWNQGAEQLYQIPSEEALGKQIDFLVRIEQSELERAEIRRLVHETGTWRGEVLHRSKPDHCIWVDWSINLLRDATGEPMGMMSITKNIGKRKALMEQLEESHQLFDTFMENLPGLILIKDHDHQYRYFNGFAFRGIADSSWIGKTANEVFDPVLAKKINIMDHNAMTHGPLNYLDSLPSKFGDLIHVQMCKFPIHRKGKPPLLGGIGLDITELTQLEAARQENEDRLRYALEASDSGLWDWNISNNMCHFSPRFCTLLGYDPKELQPTFQSWETLVHADDLPDFKHILQTYRTRHHESFETEIRLKGKNGQYRWSLIQGRLVEVAPQGNPVRMVGTLSDITRRKEMEEALRESAELNESLMNAMPDLIFRFDEEGRVVSFKPSSDIPTMVPAEIFLGTKAQDYLPPETVVLFERTLKAALETGKTQTVEYSLLVGGDKHYYEGRMAACGEKEVLMSIRDITDRTVLLEEKHKQQLRLETILQTIPDRLMMINREGVITESLGSFHLFDDEPTANQSLVDVGSTNFLSLLSDDDANLCRQAIERTYETGLSQTVEYRCPLSSRTRWIEARTNLSRLSASTKPQILWIMRDITRRKQEEKEKLDALTRSQKQQDLLSSLASHPALIRGNFSMFASVVCEQATKLLNAERASLWLLSRDRLQWHCQNEFVQGGGKPISDSQTRTLAAPGFQRLLGTKRVVTSHSPQTEVPFTEIAPLLRFPEKSPALLCAALRQTGHVEGILLLERPSSEIPWTPDDETYTATLVDQLAQAMINENRITAEKERKKTARDMATLIQLLPDLVFFKDSEGRYVLVNHAFEKAFSLESRDIIGRRDEDILHPQHALPRKQTDEIVQNERREVRYEEEIILPNGDVHTFDTIKIPLTKRGKPFLGLVGISRDITDRLQTESKLRSHQEQLRQSQRMEAIGRLAGGIAHDFNNLLTGITGNVSLMQMDVHAKDPLHEYLDDIEGICERAKDLTRKLLAFSRKQEIQPRVLDLNQVLLDFKRMLQRSIGEDIELITELEENLPLIKVDLGLLEQAILNLCVNARDAMPEGGRLILRTERQEKNNATTGETQVFAVLHSIDTGLGMDEETQQHIFEPFFTTKSSGKGTGLGLSTVWGIVHQHDGELSVDSSPGEGTAFHLLFPETSEVRSEIQALPKPSAATLPRGTETLLLVEDEEIAMKTAHRLLTRLGYKVIQAKNGMEAQMREEMHNGPIDIMVTDIVMPKLNGRDLAKILAEKRPEMKVLFVSGHAPQLIGDMGMDVSSLHFMAKPYNPPALAWKIREVLKGHSC